MHRLLIIALSPSTLYHCNVAFFLVDLILARRLSQCSAQPSSACTTPTNTCCLPSYTDASLSQMLDMGYSLEEARAALILCDGNVEDAVQAIYSQDTSLQQAVGVTPTVSQQPSL